MDKKIHERLRAARIEAGLKQGEVAEILNVSPVSVNRWENGKRIPTAEIINQLAKIYKTNSDFIIAGNEEAHSNRLLSEEHTRLLKAYDKAKSPIKKAVLMILENS